MSKGYAYFNGVGKEMDYSMFHVPMKYLLDIKKNDSVLTVIDILKTHATVAWKSDKTGKTGIHQRVPIVNNCIIFKGKKIKISSNYGWVI